MPKYKFILTLPYDYEIDSQYDIDDQVSYPNYSHASPVRYKGIFDSYNEAQEYAAEFEIYKYILTEQNFDSFEDTAGNEYPGCYISIYDAEDAACADLQCEPGETRVIHPEYIVEEVTEEDPENDIPAGVYKFLLLDGDECILDSIEEYGDYFDTYEEAQEAAEEASESYDMDSGEPLYELETVEILDIKIVEIDE